MSCPVAPVLTIEQPTLEISIPAAPSGCDQNLVIGTTILYNGQALYNGIYNYGMGQ